jgi:hypothetical protein
LVDGFAQLLTIDFSRRICWTGTDIFDKTYSGRAFDSFPIRASGVIAKDLLNSRMAYVSISRGAHDAQIFTNDREKLPTVLGREISKQTAQVSEISAQQTIAPQQGISKAPQQEHGMGLGIGI